MRFLVALVLSYSLMAQIPERDSRNTNIPNTDTHFQARNYARRAEWEAKKVRLRRQILVASGLDPLPEKTPLNPSVFGRLERESYSIEKVYLETLPGYYLGGNLYRPLGKTGPFPAIAQPHGHWNCGRLENQPLSSPHTLSVNLARDGFVVFTYDMVGYNDTVQTPHVFGGPAEQLWSFGPFGLQLWNSIRVVDFLQSLPEVDKTRIGATGASGGGTQTFAIAAVDDRVGYSAPVNMVSAIMQGGCRCENAPGLRLDTFNLEVAAMTAPKPMMLVSSTQDWTKNTPREEFPEMQKIYNLYGATAKVATVQIDAPHNYNRASRQAVHRFFAQHMQGRADTTSIEEREAKMEMLQDLLVFHGRSLPAGALDYNGLFTQWKRASDSQNQANTDAATARERMQLALAIQWPEKVLSFRDGEKLYLYRPEVRDRIPAVWFPGNGTPLLAVHENGAAAARQLSQVQKAMTDKRPVLLIDAFQTGTAVAPRDRSHTHFLTFNLSDDANRAQDIVTALSFLHANQKGRIELSGSGKGAVWSLFAAAVAPIDVDLVGDLSAFHGSDEEFITSFFVPGIQRAGGLKAALRLTDGRRRTQ